jgi:hypothetical protein
VLRRIHWWRHAFAAGIFLIRASITFVAVSTLRLAVPPLILFSRYLSQSFKASDHAVYAQSNLTSEFSFSLATAGTLVIERRCVVFRRHFQTTLARGVPQGGAGRFSPSTLSLCLSFYW